MSTTRKNRTSFAKPSVISVKQILDGELFAVEQYRLKMPSSIVKTHKVIQRKSTVSVFPVTKNHELYLVRQYRYLHKKVTTEAMAGFIDPGESPLVAAKRELAEETGLTAKEWKQLVVMEVAASVLKGTNYLYLAQDLKIGLASPEEDEDIELVKLPFAKAVSKVMRGDINHAASMIGILMLGKIFS